MKFSLLSALLVCASPVALNAAGFVNGQAARAVIGQYEFTDEQNLNPSDRIVGGIGGLAYTNGELWVAEGNLIGNVPINNRVVGFPISQIPLPTADLSALNQFDILCGLCGFGADTVLGQADFVSNTPGRSQTATSGGAGSMNTPTAVATDGRRLAVADTDNDRVLIWNSLPTGQINPAPDLVLGQPDFTTLNPPANISASSFRVPNGVWIDQSGRLYVADTGNSRVLIWNRFPTTNNQPADVVLGQPNFTSNTAPSLTSNLSTITTAANLLWDPTSVSVSADGTRLIVADFGYNRVLIWNTIPTQNQQPADVVLGQSSMTGAQANNTSSQCASNGTDSSGNATYPALCATTFDHPRYAIADNTYLYVADTGNDRVLLFNIANGWPTANDPAANIVIGQPNFTTDVDVTNTDLVTSAVDNTGSTDTIPQPLSLALDGTNLYVADPYNHRVMIFTPADIPVSGQQVLNHGSEIVQQEGLVVLAGTITSGDTVTITISGTDYTYTIKSGDTLASVVTGLVGAVNAGSGDPNATAYADTTDDTVLLLAKNPVDLNTIAYSATSSNTTDITATAAGAYLAGGNSGTLAPGTIVEINNPNVDSTGTPLAGQAFSDFSVTEPAGSALPIIVQNPSNPASQVQVYVDGFPVPILSVSPTQIVFQLSYTFEGPSNSYTVDRNSITTYLRWLHSDGTVTVSTAAPSAFTDANPGLFAQPGATEPRPAILAYHQAGNPSSSVQLSGAITAGDSVAITISSATYSYTVTSTDTLSSIAQTLATQINAAPDPNVTAVAYAGSTIILNAIQSGSAGTGISVSAAVTASSSSGTATETATVLGSTTCCATTGTGAVTAQNPAQPNEVILFTATGLGNVQDVNGNIISTTQAGDPSNPAPVYFAGTPYNGPEPNTVVNLINATVSGSSASVVSASLGPNPVSGLNTPGYYTVAIQMPSTLPTSGIASVYIAQNAFISNTVSIPVGTPVSGSTSTVYNGSAGKWASMQTGSGTLPATTTSVPATTSAPSLSSTAGAGSGTVSTPVYVPYVGAFPVLPSATTVTPSSGGGTATAPVPGSDDVNINPDPNAQPPATAPAVGDVTATTTTSAVPDNSSTSAASTADEKTNKAVAATPAKPAMSATVTPKKSQTAAPVHPLAHKSKAKSKTAAKQVKRQQQSQPHAVTTTNNATANPSPKSAE